MLRAVKHIATVALCLLIIFGAAGTHLYVFVCSNNHHAAQLSLTADHHSCCSHNHDNADKACHHEHGEASTEYTEISCACISLQTLSLSNFEVSQLTELEKAAVMAMLFEACCTCDGECCHALTASLASSFVHPPYAPDIYSYGQLRL